MTACLVRPVRTLGSYKDVFSGEKQTKQPDHISR